MQRVFHLCFAFCFATAMCNSLIAGDDSLSAMDPGKQVSYFTECLKQRDSGGLRGANLEGRAGSYLLLGEPTNALADLNDLISHEDTPPLTSYYLRGLAHYVIGEYEEAARDFRFTYEGNDGGVVPRIGYLLSRVSMGKGSDAWIETYLKRVVDEGDTDAPLSVVLTMLLGKTSPEDYLKAVDNYVSSLKPDYGTFFPPEDVQKLRDERDAELKRTRKIIRAEANYYVYQYYRIQKNDEKAMMFLRKSATCDELPDYLWPVVGRNGIAQQELKKRETSVAHAPQVER